MTCVLTIDQGTTNTKALLFSKRGAVVAQASARCRTNYPRPGWAEQSAEEIWSTTKAVIEDVLDAAGDREIAAVGISNQRETIIAWNAETGEPVGPAILWQCRRTAEACSKLVVDGYGPRVQSLTGLQINPLFPASKIAWLVQNNANAAALFEAGTLRVGTVDSWLVWNLTGGQSFATDHSNASRTLLLDTQTQQWSEELVVLFGTHMGCLPNLLPSDGNFGDTSQGATALPAGIPILSVMGDSHAALYGHAADERGVVKATFGTGSSLMCLTPDRLVSQHDLSSTIGWSEAGRVHHAIEGNITVSAQAAAFATEMLGLGKVEELSVLAQTVEDSEGVAFVPALAGLGAPHWDDAARGTVSGLSLGSTRAHLARATFEAIVHQIADVFEAMESDVGHNFSSLAADGGASANDFLMQLQADLIGVPVMRSDLAEVGASGVARMAFSSLGLSMGDAGAIYTTFKPSLGDAGRCNARARWRSAVDQARSGPLTD